MWYMPIYVHFPRALSDSCSQPVKCQILWELFTHTVLFVDLEQTQVGSIYQKQ